MYKLLQQMFMIRRFGSVIQAFDMFKVPTTLLCKSQEVGSVFGGIVSIIALALTMVLFFPNVKEFFSFTSFSYEQTEKFQSPDVLYKMDSSIFNISVATLGYSGKKRAYDIIFQKRQQIAGVDYVQEYKGAACDFQWWRLKFGEQVYRQALIANQSSICAPPDFNMSIYGRYTTSTARVVVLVKRCYDADCVSDAEYATLNPFFLLVLFPDVKFRYNEVVPYQFTLNDNTVFNIYPGQPQILGSHIILKQYVIDDQNVNIWPNNLDFLANKGKIKSLMALDRTFDKKVYFYGPVTCSFTFMKSPVRVTVQRKIIKIDQLISNLGGFLAIFLGLAQFFAVGYNDTLLKMKVGKRIKFEQEESFEDKFSIFQHFKLSVFGSCIESRAGGNYAERSKLLLTEIEQNFSIDSLLDRLANCEHQIQSLSGSSDWKAKKPTVDAADLEFKEYEQAEGEEAQVSDESSMIQLKNKQVIENCSIVHKLTGQTLGEWNGRLILQSGGLLQNKEWKLIHKKGDVLFEKQGKRLSVGQLQEGSPLGLGGRYDAWAIRSIDQQACKLGVPGTSLVLGIVDGQAQLVESTRAIDQQWSIN